MTGNSVVPAAKAPWVVLRAAAVPTAVAGVIAVIVCWLIRGGSGALGAAIGTVIVLAFFSAGQYALGRILTTNPDFAMTGALTIYLVKIGILFAFIAAFKNTTLFDSQCFGMTVLACTLVWIVAEVWAMGRTKMLYVEPVPSSTTPVPAAAPTPAVPADVVVPSADQGRTP